MFNRRDELGFVILMMLVIILAVLIRQYVRRKRNQLKRLAEEAFVRHSTQSEQNNIYNISGRVQGQNQHAYPDAYLSIDHIAITNEMNKPPPKYDDAPPSYEEALKLAMAHSNSLQTFQNEQGHHSADLPRAHQPTSSATVAANQ